MCLALRQRGLFTSWTARPGGFPEGRHRKRVLRGQGTAARCNGGPVVRRLLASTSQADWGTHRARLGAVQRPLSYESRASWDIRGQVWNGLVVDVVLSQATGTAETEAALTMLERVPIAQRITVGALDRRTSRHAGYAASQRARKRIEEMPAG